MKEAETCAKTRISSQVLTEDGDGNFKIISSVPV